MPNGEITVGADASPVGVESWVTDTGQGIAPEFVEKVFEKFETRVTRGTSKG